MEVLGDAVARERRSEAPALRHAPSGREYDYHRFCTTAWKVGNFLRNEGVRDGMLVAVADESDPEPVLALYGAALLGAVVTFTEAPDGEPRALIVPTGRLAAFDVGPRTRRIGYGGEPTTPSAAYFERDVWSENPTMPPDSVVSEAALLRTDDGTYTHADVLEGGHEVVASCDLDRGDRVAVRGSLSHPGVVAAGVVAPALAGATVLLPNGEAGDVGVGRDVPEPTGVDPDDVL